MNTSLHKITQCQSLVDNRKYR